MTAPRPPSSGQPRAADPSSAEAWLSDFELGAPIEAGTHTETRRARRRHDDRAVVLRVSKAPRRSFAAVRRALVRESEVLRGVDHPAIPALLDVIEDKGKLALVIEDKHRGALTLHDLAGRLGDRLQQRHKLDLDRELARDLEQEP